MHGQPETIDLCRSTFRCDPAHSSHVDWLRNLVVGRIKEEHQSRPQRQSVGTENALRQDGKRPFKAARSAQVTCHPQQVSCGTLTAAEAGMRCLRSGGWEAAVVASGTGTDSLRWEGWQVSRCVDSDKFWRHDASPDSQARANGDFRGGRRGS